MYCKICGKLMEHMGFDDGGCEDSYAIAELWHCALCERDDCWDIGHFEDEESDQ